MHLCVYFFLKFDKIVATNVSEFVARLSVVQNRANEVGTPK